MAHDRALPSEVVLNGPDGSYTYTLSRIDFPKPKMKGKPKTGLKRNRNALVEEESAKAPERPHGKGVAQRISSSDSNSDSDSDSDSDDEPVQPKRPRRLQGEIARKQPAGSPLPKLVPTRTESHPGPKKTLAQAKAPQPLMPARPLSRPGPSKKPLMRKPPPSAKPPSPNRPMTEPQTKSPEPASRASAPKKEVIRVKGALYRSPHNFCNNQKIACLDIYHEAALASRLKRPTALEERDFLHRIFQNGWYSELPPPAAPKLGRREVARTRREIGIIKEDVLPTQKGKEQCDVRRKGGSVYARIRLDDDDNPVWAYSDANNRPVRSRYVSWGTEEQGQQAFHEAIEAWDRAERERVTSYNMALAVYMARLWVAHWSKYGYPTAVSVRQETAKFEHFVSMGKRVCE